MTDVHDNNKAIASAFKALQRKERLQAFDPEKPASRPTPKQLEVMKDIVHRHIYVVAGNQSGKTQLGGWTLARKFEENHPYWKRSPDWGKEKMTLIVAARLYAHVVEIWETKIQPYLEPGSYTLEKDGPYIKRLIHKKNGNKVYFFSHDKAKEAQQKVQMFVAHHVWCDEMPSDVSFLTELQQRVTARSGQLMCTFTPVIKNDDIKDMVDNVDPKLGVKYQMSKLDNPIYKGREEELFAEVASLPIDVQNCRLYGDWLQAEMPVFTVRPENVVMTLPDDYSTQWEHVVAVDPASAGTAGLIICTRSPVGNQWYVVSAEYISGQAPSVFVQLVEAKLRPYNITTRVYDPHETWFQKEALVSGIVWRPVHNKSQRKKELITTVQQYLWDLELIIPDTQKLLLKELRSAEWKDANFDGIKNSTRFHIVDALQYLLDILKALPKRKVTKIVPQDQQIYVAMKEQMVREDKERRRDQGPRKRSPRAGTVRRRRSVIWG
jgi:hypothetical protein